MVNLSSKDLTSSQVSLLSKGFSFCPNSQVDLPMIDCDLSNFFRSIKLKVWFRDKIFVKESIISEFTMEGLSLQQKSRFNPVVNEPSIDAFIRNVTADINSLKNVTTDVEFQHPNLTTAEVEALRILRSDTSLVLKTLHCEQAKLHT